MYRIGVDEAGKGPVLGPMVVAAVRAAPADLPEGVADSKRLAPARREELAATLRASDGVAVGIAVVPVDRIDDPATDMNTLTVSGHAEAVAAVASDGDDGNGEADADIVVADAGDVSEARFARRLREGAADRGARVEVTAEHGADDAHPVAGAASVVAKVERDRRVATLAEAHPKYDVGSGYPSDPTTRTFLREYVRATGSLPDCARASWSTCDDVLAAAEQSALDDF